MNGCCEKTKSQDDLKYRNNNNNEISNNQKNGGLDKDNKKN